MKIVLALALLIVIAKANPSEVLPTMAPQLLDEGFNQNNVSLETLQCQPEETHLFALGTSHKIWTTVPYGSWQSVKTGGWVSRIIIHGDTIYGIGSNKAIYSSSIHGSSWTKITDPSVTDLAYWNGVLYAVGTDGAVYWTPPMGLWRKLSSGGWVSRIIIHHDTIYGIGRDGPIYSTSVHGGSWTKVTTGKVVDLAYWNGHLYGVGTDGRVYWTVPNGSWSKLSGDEVVSRIIIDDNTIYGFATGKEVFSRSTCVHYGSWTKIADCCVIDLAYWKGSQV